MNYYSSALTKIVQEQEALAGYINVCLRLIFEKIVAGYVKFVYIKRGDYLKNTGVSIDFL